MTANVTTAAARFASNGQARDKQRPKRGADAIDKQAGLAALVAPGKMTRLSSSLPHRRSAAAHARPTLPIAAAGASPRHPITAHHVQLLQTIQGREDARYRPGRTRRALVIAGSARFCAGRVSARATDAERCGAGQRTRPV